VNSKEVQPAAHSTTYLLLKISRRGIELRTITEDFQNEIRDVYLCALKQDT
jgi:hypothetical protein